MVAGIGRTCSADGRDSRGAGGANQMTGMRILRKREVLERLGIRKTAFYSNFVKTGRLRLVKIGDRAVGVIEQELDALIEELRRERDRRPHPEDSAQATAPIDLLQPS
jgi:predicted DNA-binding transcriptional regulator AlpA